MNKVVIVVLENQCDVTEEISLSTLNLLNLSLLLWTFARSESYIKNGIEVHKVRERFLAVVLTNFKHPFDLTIIKIISSLYNTIRTIVSESRETLWIALYLSLFRETFHTILLVGKVVAFNVIILFGCCFLHALRMINGCDVTPIIFKCRLIELIHCVKKVPCNKL